MKQNLTFMNGKRRAHKLVQGVSTKYHMPKKLNDRDKNETICTKKTAQSVLTRQELVWVHNAFLNDC